MPTIDEAKASGRPFRVEVNVKENTREAIYLTPQEIAAAQARAQAIAQYEATRPPTYTEALKALLAKEAADPNGDETVKAYVASL